MTDAALCGSSRRCGFVLAVVLGTVSERFNIIWYGTVVALEATSKNIGGIWIGWWIFISNLSSWIMCAFLTGNFSKIFPADVATYWLLNSSAIILGCLCGVFGLIELLPPLFFNLGNFVTACIRGALSAVVTVAVNTVIMWEFKNEAVKLKKYAGLSYTAACIGSIFVSYAVYQIKPSLFLSCLSTSLLSLLFIAPVYILMPKQSTVPYIKSSTEIKEVLTDLDSTNPLKTAQKMAVSVTSLNLADKIAPSNLKIKSQGPWAVAYALCRVPEIFLALVSQVLVFSALGAHGPMHSPFLSEVFQLEPILIGLVSCSPFIAMSVGAIFFGLVGSSLAGRKMSLIGCMVLLGTSLMIEGPDPLFCSLPQNICLHVFSLFVSAFAFSSHLVLTAEEMRQAACVHGFSQSIAVTGAIASLLGASEYASGLVGPLFGGICGETLGFERTLGILGLLCYILGFLRLMVLMLQNKYYKKAALV